MIAFREDTLPLHQAQSVLHHKTVYLHCGIQQHCLYTRQSCVYSSQWHEATRVIHSLSYERMDAKIGWKLNFVQIKDGWYLVSSLYFKKQSFRIPKCCSLRTRHEVVYRKRENGVNDKRFSGERNRWIAQQRFCKIYRFHRVK